MVIEIDFTISMNLKKTVLLLLVLFALNINNKILGQTQVWLGAHLYVRDVGVSTGIITKDKLIVKYTLTPNVYSYNGYKQFVSVKNFTSTISAGWVFSKPQKRIRMGGGFTMIHFYHERKEYDENRLLTKVESNSSFFPIPFPFFYIDYKVKNNIKVVLNTSIFLNEIGIGYRFVQK